MQTLISKIKNTFWIVVMLAILVGVGGPAGAQGSVLAARLHPLLVELAEETPGQQVSVIVQKTSATSAVEQRAEALGGKVTKDLNIINAFAAEMTAATARELAGSEHVRWISPDAPVESSACTQCIDTTRLVNAYIQAISADRVWNQAPDLQGQGITVAVVDSGVNTNEDLRATLKPKSPARIIANIKTNSATRNKADKYGHGTHIAGIIGGNGYHSQGAYIGVAPKVNLVNVKVSDDIGQATTSEVVAGLQWIYTNRVKFNIRVANLSLNTTLAESYHTSPLNAALEILWFNGIVVVVSAGNNGSTNSGVIYPPANDPFVITVGASDDMGTAATGDDVLATYSAFGMTADGFSKPDLVAPGSNIVSLFASPNARLNKDHPGYTVGDSSPAHYFRMSGTSMASAVTAGAVALLLQDEPGLTPDQVKYRLLATAHPFAGGNSAPYLDVSAAIAGTTKQSANTGLTASQLLWTGSKPITWGSAAWNSVAWGSVSWGSVAWTSVSWGSVSWGSDYWGP
ncbi:MAG TPA: S8 family serine peptidase [Anaerolineales bacterium]|nr:S8 family serine peptidase [Anaerolineales bacterium]